MVEVCQGEELLLQLVFLGPESERVGVRATQGLARSGEIIQILAGFVKFIELSF